MGYKDVYRFLQEVFPQVDSRILKAVAFEHSEDADSAAEFIISEVLSSVNGSTKASDMFDDADGRKNIPIEVGMQKMDLSSENQGAEDENAVVLPGSLVACQSNPLLDHSYSAHISYPFMGEKGKESLLEVDESKSILHHQEAGISSLPSELSSSECEVAATVTDDKNASAFQCNSHLCKEAIVSTSNVLMDDLQVFTEKSKENGTSSGHLSRPSQGFEENCSSALSASSQELHETKASGSVTVVSTDAQCSPKTREKSLGFVGIALEMDMNCTDEDEIPLARNSKKALNMPDSSNFECSNSSSAATTSAEDISSSIIEGSPNILDGDTCSEKYNNASLIDVEGQDSRVITESISELDFLSFESHAALDSDKPTTVATQSGHVARIDLLEDFMADVKSSKKTLVSAMESTANMMRKVEHLEDKAKKAKGEASEASQDILMKAAGVGEMMKLAKEANDMRGGEVYGERAMLATEARELQSRLISLSDERDKSLSIIEEIHRTLEARLAAAGKELVDAEKEKIENAEAAQNTLTEQEAMMEEVVQESVRVQQEVEENSKLREFLMDRGRILDMLQGDISGICEDIMLLKEKVDGRVPVKKSLPSTSWILSSSSSSSCHSQRTLLERTPSPMELGDTGERTSQELPLNLQQETLANGHSEIDDAADANKQSFDDDWDFFDLA